MLRFRLEREGDGMKHWWKMKRNQRAHLDFMGGKRDTAQQRGDVDRRRDDTREERRGDTREETPPFGLTQILLGQKMKSTHAIDLATTNGR
jgi:hypothetical protein